MKTKKYILFGFGMVMLCCLVFSVEASFTRLQEVYYYDTNDGVILWENNPDDMNDGDENTYANTSLRNDPQNLTSNTGGNDSGNPRDVSVRWKSYYNGASGSRMVSVHPKYEGKTTGSLFVYNPTTTPAWTTWRNMTGTNNAPTYNNWSWNNISKMDMHVTGRKSPGGIILYCSMVELRVNFTNDYPTYTNGFPSNNSVDVQLNRDLSIDCNDNESDLLNVTFYSNLSGSWSVLGSSEGYNRTYYYNSSDFSTVNTSYFWNVSIYDGYTWVDTPIYSFTTRWDVYGPSVEITNLSDSATVLSSKNSITVDITSSDNESEHYLIHDWNKTNLLWYHGDYVYNEGHPVLKNWVRNNATWYYFDSTQKLIMENGAYRDNWGYYDQAMRFDGSDDYAYNPNFNNLYDGLHHSFGGWVKWDTIAPETYDTQFALIDPATEEGWSIYAESGGFLYAYYYSGGVYTWTDAFSVTTDVWYHFMLVQYESNISLYVDGVWWDDCLAGDENANYDFYLGGYGTSYSFDGLLDEVVFFNRSLSGMEVKALYNASLVSYSQLFDDLEIEDYPYLSHATDRFLNKNTTSIQWYNITNAEPHIYDESPQSELYGVGIDPELSFELEDDDGNSMDVEWYSNSSGVWLLFNQNKSVGNGTISYVNTNMSDYNTTYYWYVAVFDGFDWNTSSVFNFTTVVEPTIFYGQYNGLGGTTNLGWEGDLSGGLSIEDRIIGYNVYMQDDYGIVDSVRCRLRSTTVGKDARCLIYHAGNDSLVPNAVSDSINITNTAWNWYTFTFPIEVTLDGNQQYYLCVWGNSSDGLLTVGYVSSITGGRGINRDTNVDFDGVTPDPWDNSSLFPNGAISIYVVYTPWILGADETIFDEVPANKSSFFVDPNGVTTSVFMDYTEYIDDSLFSTNSDWNNNYTFTDDGCDETLWSDLVAQRVYNSGLLEENYITSFKVYLQKFEKEYLWYGNIFELGSTTPELDYIRLVADDGDTVVYGGVTYTAHWWTPASGWLLTEKFGTYRFSIVVNLSWNDLNIEVDGYLQPRILITDDSSYSEPCIVYSDTVCGFWDDMGIGNDDLFFEVYYVPTSANFVNVSFEWLNGSVWEEYGNISCVVNGTLSSLNLNFSGTGNYSWRVTASNQDGTAYARESYWFVSWYLDQSVSDRGVVWYSLLLFGVPLWLLFDRRKQRHGKKSVS